MPEEENNNQEQESDVGGALLSPEGVMMLVFAAMMDIASIFFFALILLAGIGFLPAKILYVFGCGVITGWQLLRSGTASIKKDKRKAGASLTKKFFKKHWKKWVAKGLIDFLPVWTWTVYSELKSS